jgi:predicted transcriptional regulator
VANTPKAAGKSKPTPRLQDTVRLSAEGLAKVLGDLEARVMRVVWELGRPAPARTVHERVIHEHDVALLTVVTVLNKLVSKRLLRRKKREGLLHYEPRMGEDEFRAHAARKVVDGILSFGPASIAASFVDALAEQSPEQLEELERLIRNRLHPEES